MLTWLRIIVSCFCLVLCVLFAALWVRSLFYADSIWQTDANFRAELVAYSGDGLIGLRVSTDSAIAGVPFYRIRVALDGNNNDGIEDFFIWKHFHRDNVNVYVAYFPHLVAVTLLGICGLVAKLKPRWQFDMRELFILTTVGAITVGTLAVVLRAISERAGY